MGKNHTRSPPRISRRAGASGVPVLTAGLWPWFHHTILPLQNSDQFLEPGYQWALACKTVIYQCHLGEIQKICINLYSRDSINAILVMTHLNHVRRGHTHNHGIHQLKPHHPQCENSKSFFLPWHGCLQVKFVILNDPLPWLKFLQETLCTLYRALNKMTQMELRRGDDFNLHLSSQSWSLKFNHKMNSFRIRLLTCFNSRPESIGSRMPWAARLTPTSWCVLQRARSQNILSEARLLVLFSP